MKNILIKKEILILIIGVLFLPLFANASSSGTCSRNGYTVISLNGMLTTSTGAISNKDKIEINIPPKYNSQRIVVDSVYNATHSFLSDLADAAMQKSTEGLVSQTYDLTNMITDLSQKVKTQKLLFVAHSQGNFYANDIYNSIGDQPGGVAKKSMGIYGIGTPTSYIAGNGKYILSSNDKIVNLVRLKGILKVLPANVNIVGNEEEGDDPNGHYLPIYLKYENKRIASEILTMLHGLKEDETQNEAEVCIDEPELTNLHKLMGVFYYVADPISEAIKDTFNTIVDTIGKPVTNTFWNLGNKLGKAINSMFASAGDSLTSSNNSSISSSDNNQTQPEDISSSDEQNNEEQGGEQEITNQNILAVENDTNENVIQNSSTEIKKIIHRSSHSSNVNEEESNSNNEEEQDSENSNENNNGEGEESEQDDEGNDEGDSEEEQNDTSADTTNPVVSLIGESYLKLSRGTDYTESGATAVDNIDGNLEVIIDGNVNTSTVGIYTIVYRATDSSGNIGSVEREVEIYIPLEGLIIDTDTTLPSGEYFYDNVTITNNATLTLLADTVSTGSGFKGVKINANNLTVDPGSSISANGQGYMDGPGTDSENYSGGSYGGKGERTSESYTYGSAVVPTDLGSGGASHNDNNKGGGAIYFDIAGTFINNGTVSADGRQNASGGSVYVDTKNLEGSGIFRANGGGLYAPNVFYGIGGGGRVAVHFDESSFSGTVEAKGGRSSYDGYSTTVAEDGTAGLFDDKNNNLYIESSWEFLETDEDKDYDNIYVSNRAEVRTEEGTRINAKNIEFDGFTTFILSGGEDMDINEISLFDNSSIKTFPEVVLSLKADNIYIDSTSTINADSTGYVDGPGSPEPANYGMAGGSYGGKGSGSSAKSTYGSANMPTDFGSGTEASRGGGAVYIISSGEIINNGTITALSTSLRGSGGSIYVKANNFSGSGSLFAYGARGYWPYPDVAGGGGRVAVYYNENTFTGTVDVSGGLYCFSGCYKVGEDGTNVWVDKDGTLGYPSSEKEILSFKFADLVPIITGVISGVDYTIDATVPYSTDISSLVPTISISSKATVSKASGVVENFTNPVTYIVTAEDGSTRNYTVSVQVAEETGGGSGTDTDDIPPLIVEYLLNGTTEDVTVDPFNEGLVIELTANEKVDLVSLEIENKANTSIRKIYYSCDTYDTDTNTCVKTWNGELSGDTYFTEEGEYRVNVHIKDVALNETFYTLPATVIVKKRL